MLIDNKWAVALGVLIAGILVLSTPVLAANAVDGNISNDTDTANETSTASNDLFEELDQSVNEYNQNLSILPQLILTVAGDDVIFADIEMNDGNNLMVTAVTNSGEVTGFREVSSASEVESTVEITTTEDVVREVLASDRPLSTFMDSVDQGESEVEVDGFIKNAALRTLEAIY
ncbi:MAG: hypothetical protein AWU59_2370 [Methanolobus sp. T82-4]|jgi:hypothetical protein|nr:MAG: hypothetical protein AWU59_2370 [Methanolobus sp. T82-4]